VATLAYAPFAFFCCLSPLVMIRFGYMGWTITPLAAEQDEEGTRVTAAAAPSRA